MKKAKSLLITAAVAQLSSIVSGCAPGFLKTVKPDPSFGAPQEFCLSKSFSRPQRKEPFTFELEDIRREQRDQMHTNSDCVDKDPEKERP